MRKKLSLNVEALAVESFATAERAEGRGTVRAHGTDGCGADDCTWWNSCVCPSAYYVCATPPGVTHYSCNYTRDWRCTA